MSASVRCGHPGISVAAGFFPLKSEGSEPRGRSRCVSDLPDIFFPYFISSSSSSYRASTIRVRLCPALFDHSYPFLYFIAHLISLPSNRAKLQFE